VIKYGLSAVHYQLILSALAPHIKLVDSQAPCGTQRGLLPLLPSGPDGVCNLLLRQDPTITRSSIGSLLSTQNSYPATLIGKDHR